MKNNKNKTAFSLVEISVVVLVVGILVASISLASDMIAEAKLKGARTQTKGSKVNRISNLLLWLETTTLESLIDSERVNSGVVSQWKDINSQNASKIIFKNGSGSTIKYKEIGEANLPGLIFSSSSDFLYPNGSTPSVFSSASAFPNLEFTIFAVAKPISSGSIFSFCEYASSTYSCVASKEFSLKFASDKKIIFTMPSSSSASTVFTSTNSYSSPLIIISALKDSAGQKVFVNGSSAGSSVANTYNTTNLFNGTFKIGGDVGNVEIYEIIVFSKSLSDNDRNAIEDYLGKKYNLKITKTAS